MFLDLEAGISSGSEDDEMGSEGALSIREPINAYHLFLFR